MSIFDRPPKGINPDLVRRLARTDARVSDLIDDDPPPAGTPKHLIDLVKKANRQMAGLKEALGEIQANRLEAQELVDRGYREGVFPVDKEMATTADEYQRELHEFDRDVAGDEQQWAKEDKAAKSAPSKIK